jgi:glycosyltransferase involved in cell wall biosynthesis
VQIMFSIASSKMKARKFADLPPPPAGKTGWPWTVETPPLPPMRPAGQPWPRISIVTPSYNQGEFIEETIRSVVLQGYPDLEYIVIDGGSVDQSLEVIKKYEPWLNYWVSEKDNGQSHAINKGLSRSTGTIVNWLNSDDFLAPGGLRAIAQTFDESDERIGAIAGAGHKLDAARSISYSPLPEVINRETLLGWIYGGNFMQPACFFRRLAWERCGPIREDLQYCMDFAFWLEMSEAYRFKTIRTDIAFAQTHKEAKTTAQRKRMFAEIAVLLASQPDGFPIARRVAMDLADGKLVPDPGGREMLKMLLRKFSRKYGALYKHGESARLTNA